jgi:hypothetical protein
MLGRFPMGQDFVSLNMLERNIHGDLASCTARCSQSEPLQRYVAFEVIYSIGGSKRRSQMSCFSVRCAALSFDEAEL